MPASSSIQSYFSSSPRKNSDSFAQDDVQSTMPSSGVVVLPQWMPSLEYEVVDLGDLQPGPRNVMLMGRIVNFYDIAKPSKSHKAAQGCLKVMLADDTGVLTMRLWYADTQYKLRLGQLITVWAVHISNSSDHTSLAPSTAPLFTSIFPEDINRNDTTSELVSLGVFDDTADASLTLYGGLCDSAASMQPSQTVLLISCPGWRIEKTAKLFINASTRIDIDPEMDDTRRLRALARRLTRKEHVNPPFPNVNTDGFEDAPIRARFTFADINDFARAHPTETVIGYLSVVITQLNIVTPFKRNMLMSNECCGIPMFSNNVCEKCKQCGKAVTLRINPRILGPLVDETGMISSGRIILAEKAWQQLLGRTPEQLGKTEVNVLSYLEQRLVFLRVTMGFALSLDDEITRLAIWCVRN
ncbi:hypothetical protein ACN47E_001892 [Coniothyrium glycines]